MQLRILTDQGPTVRKAAFSATGLDAQSSAKISSKDKKRIKKLLNDQTATIQVVETFLEQNDKEITQLARRFQVNRRHIVEVYFYLSNRPFKEWFQYLKNIDDNHLEHLLAHWQIDSGRFVLHSPEFIGQSIQEVNLNWSLLAKAAELYEIPIETVIAKLAKSDKSIPHILQTDELNALKAAGLLGKGGTEKNSASLLSRILQTKHHQRIKTLIDSSKVTSATVKKFVWNHYETIEEIAKRFELETWEVIEIYFSRSTVHIHAWKNYLDELDSKQLSELLDKWKISKKEFLARSPQLHGRKLDSLISNWDQIQKAAKILNQTEEGFLHWLDLNGIKVQEFFKDFSIEQIAAYHAVGMIKKDGTILNQPNFLTNLAGKKIFRNLFMMNEGSKLDRESINYFLKTYSGNIEKIAKRFGVEPYEALHIYLTKSKINILEWEQYLLSIQDNELTNMISRWGISPSEFLKRSVKLVGTPFEQIKLYWDGIKDGSTLFNIEIEEFIHRIHRAKITLKTHFDWVETYKSIKLKPNPKGLKARIENIYSAIANATKNLKNTTVAELKLLNQIYSEGGVKAVVQHINSLPLEQSQKLYAKLMTEIALRKVYNPDFGKNLASSLVLNIIFMTAGHFQVSGADKMIMLATNLATFSLVEVILSRGTAKEAAYLMAHPELLHKARANVATRLTPQDAKKVHSTSQKLMDWLYDNAFRHSKDVGLNVGRNFKPLGLPTFAISLLPMTMGAALDPAVQGATNVIGKGLLDATIASAYVSTSSSVRYEILYGKIFPTIGNSQLLRKHELFRNTLVIGLISANLVAGPGMVSWLYDTVYNVTGADFAKDPEDPDRDELPDPNDH